MEPIVIFGGGFVVTGLVALPIYWYKKKSKKLEADLKGSKDETAYLAWQLKIEEQERQEDNASLNKQIDDALNKIDVLYEENSIYEQDTKILTKILSDMGISVKIADNPPEGYEEPDQEALLKSYMEGLPTMESLMTIAGPLGEEEKVKTVGNVIHVDFKNKVKIEAPE